MPRRNGLNPLAGSPATDEFLKRAAALQDDAIQLGVASKRLAGDAAHRATEMAQDYYRRGRTRAGNVEKAVEDNVRAHPVRSILMAAGIGFLLAMLLGRR
ncbi:MAG TPA: hypothetical protein VG056_09460 [Pirellulales bacterium]|jgi:ElaB/YqjD/DUF883 family membrane-anchored ribosome-binding protein|nr:hypothetical protein [Pirellulales bacterium]